MKHLNLNSAIIVGHSIGGAIAAYLAAEYPQYVRAVAILDQPASQGNDNNLNDINYDNLKDSFTGDWPMPFMTLNEAKSYLKEASRSELEYEFFMNSLIETVEGYKMMFSSRAMALNELNLKKWFNKLNKIRCKTLLITKKRDHESEQFKDFVKMSKMLSDCIMHEMSDPDHNVHLANKEEFYRYFDEFLNWL